MAWHCIIIIIIALEAFKAKQGQAGRLFNQTITIIIIR
jgi:hypothetical protein